MEALIHDIQGRITKAHKDRSAEKWNQIRREVIEFTALDSAVAYLPKPARDLLAHLSVFRRPFPIEALEQGLGVTPDAWQPLLDWAMLRYNPIDSVYHLHSLTMHYAEGLLMEEERKNADSNGRMVSTLWTKDQLHFGGCTGGASSIHCSW